ncbi:hypothetical protein QVD17_03546 [Tagetes erecta]|uniref:PPIase cyclophilin-type domain-containing protein n=1 Tax=Tagetes erecta TaxID=13708 RepID=A0AAD8P8S2_TARER|nr:hypothetical protein QVD17_03546 [Tagetes erecta]
MTKSFSNWFFYTLVLSISCLFPTISTQDSPLLGSARVVFQTNYGDIEFGFYPSVAPQTVDHIYKLVRLGCYDTNHFFRVDKGFVAQVADVVTGRTAPMNEEQMNEAEKTIKGEFSDVKHVRGVISMGRSSDRNVTRSSFAILLGDAPHLDHKYAIFGKLTKGDETLKKLEKLPTRREGKYTMPTERVTILSTYYYDTEMEPCHQASPQGNQCYHLALAHWMFDATASVFHKVTLWMFDAGYAAAFVSHKVAHWMFDATASVFHKVTLWMFDAGYVAAFVSHKVAHWMLDATTSVFHKVTLWMFDAGYAAAFVSHKVAHWMLDATASVFHKVTLWMFDAAYAAAFVSHKVAHWMLDATASVFHKVTLWMFDAGYAAAFVFHKVALWMYDTLSFLIMSIDWDVDDEDV